MSDSPTNYEYDIAFSFAGEDRGHAESIAALLKESNVRVFYDLYEEAELWGKDLYQHLCQVYRDRARFCLVFLSASYAQKLWTRHELKQAQARAFSENSEYILPLRIDDTEIPGISRTTAHIDLRNRSISHVVDIILKKLEKENELVDRSTLIGLEQDTQKKSISLPQREALALGRMEVAIRKLSSSSALSGKTALAIDKALEDKDYARFNRLKQDQAEELYRQGEYILEYIKTYLDTRRKGEISRFKIRFTDSRALFGGSRLYEWMSGSSYLVSLEQLSILAAKSFPGEGLVSRTFIIPSFSELSLDPSLHNVLKEVMARHLGVGILTCIVTIRVLEDLGFDTVNFCVFEGGLLMKLDIGPNSTLQIFNEATASRFTSLHDRILDKGEDCPGIVAFRSLKEFHSSFEARIGEQVRRETQHISRSRSIIKAGDSASKQYNEQVARWWSDTGWDKERRQKEEEFLLNWVGRFIDHPASIIDAACGTGSHAFMLAKSGYTITGCDASWHQIDRARRIAKNRILSSDELSPHNPFFRTLSWLELPIYYPAKFNGVLCLGGSLIHAPSSDLEAIALALCKTTKAQGYIFLDHRNGGFFDYADNCFATHSGHTRRVSFDKISKKIIFRMTDDEGASHVIDGVLHSIPDIIAAFKGAGADLIDIHQDFSFQRSDGVHEWNHLIFKVI